jgi:hypothetical protein
MSKHITAMGKSVDMAAIRAKNETTRAVGNMNVNARGDIIDSNNQVINDNAKRVNRMYQRTTTNLSAQAKSQYVPGVSIDKEDTASIDSLDMDLYSEPNPKKS